MQFAFLGVLAAFLAGIGIDLGHGWLTMPAFGALVVSAAAAVAEMANEEKI